MSVPTSFVRKFARAASLIRMLVFPLLVGAQTPAAGPASIKVLLQQRKSNFAQSATQYVAGQRAAAEQTLLAASVHKAGSLEWRHDAGLQFYSMAIYLRSVGHETTARTVLSQGMQELELAITLANAKGDAVAAANSHQQIGVIYDVFFCDVKSALSRMQQAQRLNPNGKNLDREVSRLTRADELLTAKKPGK